MKDNATFLSEVSNKMYVLFAEAFPDESNTVFTKGREPLPIYVIVNTVSEKYALEKAEKILREEHWINIDIQKFRLVPEDEESQLSITREEWQHEDCLFFVFPGVLSNPMHQKR